MTEEHHTLLPRPPPAKTMADFVVTVFVILVSTSIMLAVIGTGLVVIFRPGSDVSSIIAILTDIINTIIGALIGFLAGREHGRAQATEPTSI